MKVSTTLILILFGLTSGVSQKVVEKAMVLPHVTAIHIDASPFSEITLNTAPGAELHVEATMEGEYQKDLGIGLSEEGSVLVLSGSFQPYFEIPNDKLSAHKVVSVTLLVQVPEDLEVLVFGNSTQVGASGVFRELEIVLNDGTCLLDAPRGKVKVHTQSGNIHLKAEMGGLEAISKFGVVEGMDLPDGKNQYNLKSIRGNIYIKPTGKM